MEPLTNSANKVVARVSPRGKAHSAALITGDVVTATNSGDSSVKYINDGDLSLYEPEALARREALAQSPALIAAMGRIWDLCCTPLPSGGESDGGPLQRLLSVFLEQRALAAVPPERRFIEVEVEEEDPGDESGEDDDGVESDKAPSGTEAAA